MTNYRYLLLFLLILASCASPPQSSQEVETARKVVIDYYSALNSKDYQTMYSLVSDGFKELEPTAKTFGQFQQYMSKFFDTADSIKVTNTEIESSSDTKVVVKYTAEIRMNTGKTQELKSSFTVVRKPNGWKLIHPYGDKIDSSE